MKPAAVLINSARGPIVDTDALFDALQSDRLAAAALDVLPEEPPDPQTPLLGLGDKVLLSPHMISNNVGTGLQMAVPWGREGDLRRRPGRGSGQRRQPRRDTAVASAVRRQQPHLTPNGKGPMMIYEARSYRISRGKVPEFLTGFEEGYRTRSEHSQISAMLYTEIGPLNQVIHIWPYADMGERERVRGEAFKDPNWPPKVSHVIETMQSEIFAPLPFTPHHGERRCRAGLRMARIHDAR